MEVAPLTVPSLRMERELCSSFLCYIGASPILEGKGLI